VPAPAAKARRRAPGRWRALLVLGALAAGCAGRSAPWHVPPGAEDRFRESRRVCRMLTDEDGALHEDRFERCMERRGWEREGWLRRLFD